MDSITPFEALKRMRQLTDANVPFSLTFITYNSSKKNSNGIKTVKKALLRPGLSESKSEKANILVGYTEEPASEPRWFYYPLLLKFNGITVKP